MISTEGFCHLHHSAKQLGPLSRENPAAEANIPRQQDRLPGLGSKVLFFPLFCPLLFMIQNVPLGVSLWEGRRGSAQHHTKPSMLLLDAQARLDSFQPSCQKSVCLPKKTKLPGKMINREEIYL